MADKGIPPINANQPIVDPATGKGKPAFILIINQLIGKLMSSTSAAIAALTASAPTSTTLSITGKYDPTVGVDIELKPLAPDPAGTYGDATHFATVVVDEYGRVTSASEEPAAGAITVTDGTTSVANVGTVKFTSGATVTAGAPGEADVAISGGGGGGGGVVSLAKWDFAIDGAIAALVVPVAGLEYLEILASDVTKSASGWIGGDFSFDGGVTWPAVSNDYRNNWPTDGNVGSAGAGSDTRWFMHGTAATAARSIFARIWGISKAGPKWYVTPRDNHGVYVNRNIPTHFRVAAILTATTNTTFNGGTIEILGR